MRRAALVFLSACGAGLLVLRGASQYAERRHPVNPITAKYGISLAAFYPELSSQDIEQLLRETWSRPLILTSEGVREAPYRGTYIHVSEDGFREVPEQGPWPPDRHRYFTVFLFGGSTVFNYGVPDNQTMAAHLQARLSARRSPLPPRVYNFGVGYYASTQERERFEALIRRGMVPDLAVFVDGMNDFHYTRGEPPVASQSADLSVRAPGLRAVLMQRLQQSLLASALRRGRNVLLGYYTTHRHQRSLPFVGQAVSSAVERYYNDRVLLQHVIDRYLANKAAIESLAQRAGVQTLFVWQPVPTYRYDLRLHPFASDGFGQHTYGVFGYPLMAEEVRRHPLGNNFQWCADIQANAASPLYLDKVHYSGRLSQLVADCIVAGLPGRHAVK